MPLASMQNPAQRIGKIKGEILSHAVPVEVLGLIGEKKQMPKNSGDTVVFRRWLPLNATTSSPNTFFTSSANTDRGNTLANSFLSSEGATPQADTLIPQDITVTMNEYTVLFGYTKRTADLYEDDVPAAMKEQTGERMGLILEMVRFGQIKGGTSKQYGGTVTSRATVNGKITPTGLRKAARTLKSNHTEKCSSILSASPNFGTSPVEASFFVFIHTDVESDVRDLPKFTPVAEYGTAKPVSPHEIGKWEEFRFIASPELVSVQSSGAAVGATGLMSTNATSIDVYQTVIMGKNAYGDVALRGKNALDVHDVPPNKIDKNDPTGQRGYFGASTYFNAVVLNNGWFVVYEHGVSSLA